ncbi:MAG: DUF354 domain-containing protein, partial [Candidatus Heimdallarchaeota archaeon]
HHLANAFESAGHETLITTRPYSIDRANSNLDRLGRNYTSLGKYGGASLEGKILASSERILELVPLISEYKPDLLLAFPSPDAFRTAFGLGIKSIQINDSPHSHAPGKLTISLANALVHSEAIESDQFSRLGVTNFYQFNGVDEILWIKGFKPAFQDISNLGLDKGNYIVVRCEESKAGYFQRMYPNFTPGGTIVTSLVDELLEQYPDLQIVAFPRYPEQEKQLLTRNVIIPDRSIDTLTLYYYAKAVMTGGGTMGREAALLGTPTMYTFPQELFVSKFVTSLGFPLKHCPDHSTILKEMINLINTPKMDEKKRQLLISQLETPYDALTRAIADLGLNL